MNKKKILLLGICMSLMMLGITSSASADIIITPETTPVWTSLITSNLNAEDVGSLVGYPEFCLSYTNKT